MRETLVWDKFVLDKSHSKKIWLLILAAVCAVFIMSRMDNIEPESKPESVTGSAQNEQLDPHTSNHQMTKSGKIYTVFGPGNVFLVTEDSEYTNKPVSVSKGKAKELQFIPHHSGYYNYFSYGDWKLVIRPIKRSMQWFSLMALNSLQTISDTVSFVQSEP